MEQPFNFTLYSDNRLFRHWWKNDVRALTKLCERFAGTHYSIEILQIAEDPQRAFHDGVFSAPSILLETADGRKRNLGGFAQTEEFLKGLQSPKSFVPSTSQQSISALLPSLKGFAVST